MTLHMQPAQTNIDLYIHALLLESALVTNIICWF